MTKIQDIDIAFIETLKAHPDFIQNIYNILYKNATDCVNQLNFTSKNMARTRVSRKDSIDFIEYIIKNTTIIYYAYQEMIKKNNGYEEFFNDFSEIEKAIPIIENSNINSILYYQSHPNELFSLTTAVVNTRFNPNWYTDGQKFVPDPLEKGAKVRYQIDSIGTDLAADLLDKIDRDIDIIKPISKQNINYLNINRCYKEVAAGVQTRYNKSEYHLDGTLFATQNVGKKRKNQEDSVIILTHPDNEKFKFLAVADGVGGLQAGEVASNFVVKELAEWFTKIPADTYYITNGLAEAFSAKIKEISDELYSKYHMRAASTLVAAIVTENKTWIASVGDSRAYSVNNNGLTLLTNDESLVWKEMTVQNNGRSTTQDIDDLRFARGNNKILRCIGQEYLDRIQMFSIPNKSYDSLLLFSDGVTDLLSQEDIKIIAQNTPREEITKVLVKQAITYDAIKNAKFRGEKDQIVSAGKDNATAAMFRR